MKTVRKFGYFLSWFLKAIFVSFDVFFKETIKKWQEIFPSKRYKDKNINVYFRDNMIEMATEKNGCYKGPQPHDMNKKVLPR